MDFLIPVILMVSICPITNLPIVSNPEWTDLLVSQFYTVTFKLIGEDILLHIPSGNMGHFNCDRYFELREKVIGEAFGADQKFIEIKSYEYLTGTPPREDREKLLKIMLQEGNRCKGYIVYGLSPFVQLIYRTGVVTITKLPYVTTAVKSYAEAMRVALRIEGITLSLRDYLKSEGFFQKDEWRFHSDVCTVEFMVNSGTILYSSYSGKLNDNAVEFAKKTLHAIFDERYITGNYYRIADYSRSFVTEIGVRKAYIEVLNTLHRTYRLQPINTFICGAGKVIRVLLLFGALLVDQKLTFVENCSQVLNLIRNPGKKMKKQKKYHITLSEIDALTSVISTIAWDVTNTQKSILDKDSPLKQIEDALLLVRQDREAIYSELQEKNERLTKAITELEKARDSAQTANRAKGQFLANMSHELRTPLNGVIGMAEILKKTNLSQEQQSYVSVITKSSNHLLSVINDVLDYSKIETGQIVLEQTAYSYVDILEDVVSIISAQAYEKHLAIITDIDCKRARQVLGDPFRLRQVLLNLAHNAVKFTSIGELTITAHVESENDDVQTVHFGVKDTGIGIANETIPMLFTQFVQADSSTTRRFGGTGLGLVISKQLVERMGGTIRVESIPGQGSSFDVKIPFNKAKCENVNVDTVRGTFQFDAHVFVCNGREREMLTRYVTDSGGNVLTSVSCGESIHSIVPSGRKTQRQLFLMDLSFELSMDEKKCLGRIEEMLEPEDLLLVTHYPTAEPDSIADVPEQCRLYRKPLFYRQFFEIIQTWSADHEPNFKVKSWQGKKDGIQNGHSTILLVEDVPTNQYVAKKMLEKLGYTSLTVCNNGMDALKLLETSTFDIIFMDVQMPVLDGFETTRAIRDIRSPVKMHDAIIIAFTAHAMEEEIKKCYACGMNDYVLKPLTLDSLRTVLARWVKASPLS